MSSTPALALVLLLAACSKSPGGRDGEPGRGSPNPSGDTASVPPASVAAAPVPPDAVESSSEDPPALSSIAAGLPLPAIEARRASLKRLDEERALVQDEAILRRHFGGALPSPIEIQAAPLPDGHRAFLVYGEPRHREPILLVVNAGGEVLWTKERPLAGTRQVVTEMVVAGGPHGEVSLLWCDIPTQIVALRKWSAEGNVLADFEVLDVDVCEALSALYWPGRGWVAVASQHGAARAQRLDEGGHRAWGPRGIDLPWKARPSSPATLVPDSDASVILLQVGDMGEGAPPDHVLAMRLDTLGTALWDRPIDLGAAPSGAPRIAAARVEPGKVRVSLGARGSATVTSAGSILGAR